MLFVYANCLKKRMMSNNNPKHKFLLFFLLFTSLSWAQNRVSGRIVDEKNKDLSKVDIFINDNKAPSFTTTTGNFVVESDSIITKLKFSRKNFTPETIEITPENAENIFVQLSQAKVSNIQEIVINTAKTKYKNKKENPAYTIMQKVWERKRNNGLEKFDTYSYKEYEKTQFDLNNLDSTFMKKKIFNKLDFIFDYADSTASGRLGLPVFLNEAVYENYGKNKPDKDKKRTLVAQKTSGFQDNQVITVSAKNLYREINIYDNILNYLDIGFQSPAGSDGFATYDYNLVDTINIRGEKAFHIRYQPKRKDILAFQGNLYIDTDTYAVMGATLKSTQKINVNFVNSIYTQLEYDNPDETTFLPKKLVTEIEMSPFSKKKGSKSVIAKRSVDYSNYEFNKPLDPSVFKRKEEEYEDDFVKKDDIYWTKARPDSLSKSEQGVYNMLDQLQQTPKFNRIVKLFETLGSGYYNGVKGLDFGPIFSVYGRNNVEGDRIRLGARTYFGLNDMWRIQFYTAYGFKDQQFKYGADARYMFNKLNRFMIGAGTSRDIVQLGGQLTNGDGVTTRPLSTSTFFARGENNSLSSVNQTSVFAAIEPWKNIQIRVDGVMQSIKSANLELFNLMYYQNGRLRKTVNDSHVTISVIAKPGARFSQTGIDRYQSSNLAPTIVLRYTRGIEGLFNADFNYNKVQFMFSKPFLIGTLGKTIVNFEAGKNFNTVPLALQNIIPANLSYGLSPSAFSQLNYYEFVADSYTTLHLEHHFNGKILSYIPLIKKLKLREVAFIRGAYGTLSDASKAINVEGFKYSAPSEHIYYEYGFGIENIGFGNLRIFRIDFNWRGNYLDRPDISKFGIKAGFQLGF
ncbi:carboxypeptidase-like regulatory domain-containing protein [Chryseobacterium flavum]|uniref:Carboxypeptidase-like regulatory domain-containing protein n=2 Tax=Chryseobacterium flavum TaxID=415851 RepID=A0A3D9CRJ1_9FLAO|nr:carboxypeptidase-like regulatory domain-containing protein [Chryseobacterium flavum]